MGIRKLGEITGFGKDKVHEDEKRTAPLPERIPGYAKALGVTEADLLGLDKSEKDGLASQPKVSEEKLILGIENIKGDTVPIIDLASGREVGRAYRHENQQGYTKAWAFHVPTNIMYPRYKQGELAYVNEDQPPRIGEDCLIKTRDNRWLLHEYGGSEDGRVKLQQYNPVRKTSIKIEEVESIHAVVGRA